MASGGRLGGGENGQRWVQASSVFSVVAFASLLVLLFRGEPGSGLAAGAIYPPGLEWDGWMDGRGANKPRGVGTQGRA